MLQRVLITIAGVIAILTAAILLAPEEHTNESLTRLRNEYSRPYFSSVDHGKLPELQREFDTPQDVTEACLACHTERHKEIMASSHWNWERAAYIEGRGLTVLGKRNILNNYCIGAQTNEQACAKCHIGFGMSDDTYDFNNARNVDCMVCHDQSEEYHKGAAMAGYPDRSVNLEHVAQSVGRPSKENCGSCHFYSGGGNNVKHGDLEAALLGCDRQVDVHMAANGVDMSCVACHTAEKHNILGRLYSVSSENSNRVNCNTCHGDTPHEDGVLNNHNNRVACQTCHIPVYAKVNPTKMDWRWSEAGHLRDGEPYEEVDEHGHHNYLSIKGRFVWEENVEPEYCWFDGTADHYLLGDSISSVPVVLNPLGGSADDPASRIIPVKVHRGDQIYDTQTGMLIQPKLYSAQHGDSAYWVDFNWEDAARAGMDRVGLPFSGEYGFIDTEMYWPVNHMVSPASEALSCDQCHTREGGRLANLGGFYLPGRDSYPWMDRIAGLAIVMSLLGVVGHGVIRFVLYRRRRKAA